MSRKCIWFAVWILVLAESAAAQNFSKLYGFGDSNIDTGWYRNSTTGSAATDAAIAAALPQGAGGKFTEGTSAMSPEVLAAYFGLSAHPANEPGGTNFATGGARTAQSNGANEGLFRGAVSMTNQISNYLASTGGHADGNALYLVGIGGNDVAFARDQTRSTANFDLFPPGSQAAQDYLRAQAQAGVAALLGLRNGGARYIMVPNLPQDFGNDQTVRDYRKLYATELWSGLQANGVNFVPVDINAVRKAIAATPGAFGFTSDSIRTSNPACKESPPLTDAFSLVCSPGNLVSPDAGQTHLFADDSHLTSAGHKIIGDLEYSLLAAPSQISMLAETAVKTRAGSGLVGAIQNQIQISQGQRSRSGWNAWVTGDVSHLDIDNYNGFANAAGSPGGMIVVGADYRVMPGVIVGGAFSVGRASFDFNRPDGRDGGGFNQEELTASAYLAYSKGQYRFDLVGTYGHLNYDIDRVVPLGIATFAALGETSGSNVSLAATAGYDLKWGPLTHGPYVGLTLQRVHIDGFTEASTGPVALSFADQTRNSVVGALGYRLNWDLGTFKPFANVAWKHEFASDDRSVTASLTTTTAPSFSLPAVTVGRDWAAATAGTLVDLGNGVTAHGSVTGTLGQHNVVKYGAQVGLSIDY